MLQSESLSTGQVVQDQSVSIEEEEAGTRGVLP